MKKLVLIICLSFSFFAIQAQGMGSRSCSVAFPIMAEIFLLPMTGTASAPATLLLEALSVTIHIPCLVEDSESITAPFLPMMSKPTMLPAETAISISDLPFWSFALIGEFNILGYQPYNLAEVFSPYLFGGVAAFVLQPSGRTGRQLLRSAAFGHRRAGAGRLSRAAVLQADRDRYSSWSRS